MIFFGTRASGRGSTPITSSSCDHCGNQTLSVHVLQRYFHVFWIPFFPLGKVAVTECTHCKEVREGKEVPESQRSAAADARRNARTPIWMFSGVAIVGVLLIFAYFGRRAELQATGEYLASPRPGDLYVVDLVDALGSEDRQYRYGVLRLDAIDGQELTFVFGNYGYTNPSEAKKAIGDRAIAAAAYFGKDEPVVLDISDVTAMHRNGDVAVIVRNGD